MSDQVFGDDFDDGDDLEYKKTSSSLSGKKIILFIRRLIMF